MEYEEAVRRLAPCGLDCSRCADKDDGEIRETCVRLQTLLDGYRRVAKIREASNPALAGYPQFEEILNLLGGAACSGCRGANCLCPIDCTAAECTKEKGIDFCFQCECFPCVKIADPRIRGRWLSNNLRMKEIGAEAFCTEQSARPRY